MTFPEEPGDLTEGTPYYHDEHGRVRLILVEDSHVYYETSKVIQENPLILENQKEHVEKFLSEVEPAPQDVSVPTNKVDYTDGFSK